MGSRSGNDANSQRTTRSVPGPIQTSNNASNGSAQSKLQVVQDAILAPFSHKKRDSARILTDLAPVIMTPRMINSATVSGRPRESLNNHRYSSASSSSSSALIPSKLDFATLGRAHRFGLGLNSSRVTSRELQIVEATDELLEAEVPEPEGVASNVSLLKGFNATIPSSDAGRSRRRQMRNVDTPRLGLKKFGMNARGMLTDGSTVDEEGDGQSVVSEEDVVMVSKGGKTKTKKRGRESLSASKILGKEELGRQRKEIMKDKENLHVRRRLVLSEIEEINHKIQTLDGIKQKLEHDLLKLQEDDLELDDELQGVKERLEFEQASSGRQSSASHSIHVTQSSRRRKGPAFLPSEHDELPPGVAFMSLESHTTPIIALDFSEPYGTLVSASVEDSQPRVWDLLSANEIGRLRGHSGTVKCIQVEDHVCLTGGEDGNIRIWDLRRVEEDENRPRMNGEDDGWGGDGEVVNLSDVAEEDEAQEGSGMVGGPTSGRTRRKRRNGMRNGTSRGGSDEEGQESNEVCLRLLEGHTQAVTALYFEDECLVTGAADKTLRQWDLTTGQCVMTMDILWAISHPPASVIPGTTIPNPYDFGSASSAAGTFAVPTPPYADGSWEMYQDFVGGLQFWGYGLVSGSGDGALRMWDMRTGQAHRTLLGHTGPVTCLQFDEIHIASGSLDKTLRIWDVRMGSTFETLKYDHAVTALQFDSRKIVAATGENGVKIYNRTSMQHSTLLTNGHMKPVERLRYMDRYLVSGGRDSVVKIWSL